MQKLKGLLLLFSILITLGMQNSHEQNRIYWAAEKRLTWNDFKGDPPSKTFKALTYSSIRFENTVQNDSIRFSIRCYMKPNESWVKAGSKTDKLLKHEQLHFDIAELIARKSRKEISLGEYDKQTFKIQFNSIAKKFLVMLNIEQDLFDQQTNHAMNENKENEWENKVANELKEMEIYGDSIVLTHLRKGLWKH